MPWWAIAYLCLMLLLTSAGFWTDWRDRKAWWFSIGGVASFVGIAAMVLTYVNNEFAERLGAWAIPILVGTIGWDTYQLWQDMRDVVGRALRAQPPCPLAA